ncbi:MAG: HAD-IIB family hydrolase [Gammaproteobacteria bacterium]|nr:HAD-IIB family hydrolase [Gammaproteobacteria bacterium]
MHRLESKSPGLYLAMISVHGLIRGHNLELGRDADTGGQTQYVVELARSLGSRPEVDRIDLFTRRVMDPVVSADYSNPVEDFGEGARIIRVNAGPQEYIRKEEIWDHLDSFADNILKYFRKQDRIPDLIHSHYADAGYVGGRIASRLGVHLIHTGHSLGRVKRRRLLATGMKRDQIESRYHITRRIEAEEDTLATAQLVVTSTSSEIDEQYGLYDHHRPEQMSVIPPGTDLNRFLPPKGDEMQSPMWRELARFLNEPEKPMILALSRPDERKNIATLIKAYGESNDLQQLANLVIVAGNRDDIRDMDDGSQDVLTGILLLIDRYDLYGKVAYPKHHQSSDVPLLYRLAAVSKGVFINPALTEPFGLTLIEAAASGLPLVATEDGGPQDIIGLCHNGELIDPLDRKAMSDALLRVLGDRDTWPQLARNGIEGVHAHYSWRAHSESYLKAIRPLIEQAEVSPRAPLSYRPMLYHDRAVFSDLDQTLLGDPDALAQFIHLLRSNRQCVTFGIATGRRLDAALTIMKRYGIPTPDVLITSVGTEIHYAPQLTADLAWPQHIDHLWTPRIIRRVLADLPGLKLQPKSEQSRYKISYYIDPKKAPQLNEIDSLLHQADQTVNIFLSFGQFLDIIPVRASKGFALRYFSDQWDIPLENILVAGGSGTDEDMIRGNTLGVVVANRHHEELSQLTDNDNIYFAEHSYAGGILEAVERYDFFRKCRASESLSKLGDHGEGRAG